MLSGLFCDRCRHGGCDIDRNACIFCNGITGRFALVAALGRFRYWLSNRHAGGLDLRMSGCAVTRSVLLLVFA
jgi:hypothetical protein